MKKFLLFIWCIISLILCFNLNVPSAQAYSSTEYMRVVTSDTPLYSDAKGVDFLFYLPYTYYVKVIGETDGMSHIECYGTGNSIALDGYVPSSFLFEDNLQVTSPYLIQNIFTLSTTVLYADENLSVPIQYIFSERELTYYGQATAQSGEILFYVSYNSKPGYVKESDVIPFSIANHPNELTFLAPETPPEQTPSQSDKSFSTDFIKIAVFACLFIAGIIALFITAKRKPDSQVASGYYDENEFE